MLSSLQTLQANLPLMQHQVTDLHITFAAVANTYITEKSVALYCTEIQNHYHVYIYTVFQNNVTCFTFAKTLLNIIHFY